MAAHDPKRAGFCVWVDRPDGAVACRYCHVIHRQPTTRKCGVQPPRVAKRTAAECRACRNFGNVVRLEPCTGCGGKKAAIKVFACAVHGECQLGKSLASVTSCRTCGDFSGG